MSASRLVVATLAAVAWCALASSCSTRGYPFWRVSETASEDAGIRELPGDEDHGPTLVEKQLGCARIVAEVVRSGKQGVGVMVVDHSPPECPVQLVSARLKIGLAFAMQRPAPAWDGDHSSYVGFVFDNQDFWNRGLRSGELELVLNGASQGTLSFNLYHAYNNAHERTPMGSWPIPPHDEEHYVFPDPSDAGVPEGDAAP